ncbi:MAG: ATP-binding protein [Planctomycetota bacterium]
MRLTPRLVLIGVVLILLPLVTVYVLSRADLPAQVEADTRRVLDDQTLLLAAWAAPRLEAEQERLRLYEEAKLQAKQDDVTPPKPEFPLQSLLHALVQNDWRYTLILQGGRVVADTDRDPHNLDLHNTRPEVLAAKRDGVGYATRFSNTLGRTMAYVARRVDAPDGRHLGYARAALAAERVEDRGDRLRAWLGRASWIALLLGGALVVLMARQLVARIQRVRDAALAVVGGDHSRRVERAGSDELGELGRSVNAMAAHFGEQVETISTERRGLQAVLAAMVEGVISVDGEERIVHCNASAGRILGFDATQSFGHPIWEVVRIGSVSQVIREGLGAGRPVEQTVTTVREGQVRVLRLHTAPLSTKRAARAGGPAGAVVVVYDVTDLRRLETVRRDFVANASHELKTPVAAIRGLVETILDDPDMDTDVRRGFLGRIRTQAGRLQGLVEEMLALSRLEAHEGRDPQRDVDIRGPVQEAFDAVAPLAAEKGIAFTRELAGEPLVVRSYPEALRRITSNLLDNAVKYTPSRGRVHLVARRDGNNVLLAVEDDGPGIAPDQRERVFERFYRVDAGRAREAGGTGLGLAIVKHLAQSMGGEVGLVDRVGPGARFEVRLPAVPTNGGR